MSNSQAVVQYGKVIGDFTPKPMIKRDENAPVIDMNFNLMNLVVRSNSDRLASLSTSISHLNLAIGSISGATTDNPSASIGLTAVNGSATTIMRSDAAPALSQAIVPTWTGIHTWAAASDVTQTVFKGNASQTVSLSKWVDSSGNLLAEVQSSGLVYTKSDFKVDDLHGLKTDIVYTGAFYCNTGLSYLVDLPTGSLNAYFTTGTRYFSVNTADTLTVRGTPSAYECSVNTTGAGNVIRSTAFESVSNTEYTSVTFVVDIEYDIRASTGGSSGTSGVKIGNDIYFRIFVNTGSVIRVAFSGSGDVGSLYTRDETLSPTTQTSIRRSYVYTITRPSGTGVTSKNYTVYENGVLLFTYTSGGSGGAQKIFFEPIFTYNGDYDGGAATSLREKIRYRNIEIIGTNFGTACSIGVTSTSWLVRQNSGQAVFGDTTFKQNNYYTSTLGSHNFYTDNALVASIGQYGLYLKNSLSNTVLVSNGGYMVSTPITGSGNVAMSASPTFTGTIIAAAATFSSTVTISPLTNFQAVFTGASKNLVSNAVTGTGSVVMSAGPTLTGTIIAAAANFSGTVALSGILKLSSATFNNANAVISAGTTYLAQVGTMSASRTVTLPAASAYARGAVIIIADESGTCTATNTIVITRAGSDTINGATTKTIGILGGYDVCILMSDGTSKWTVLSSI